jgi:hypothetical protein
MQILPILCACRIALAPDIDVIVSPAKPDEGRYDGG